VQASYTESGLINQPAFFTIQQWIGWQVTIRRKPIATLSMDFIQALTVLQNDTGSRFRVRPFDGARRAHVQAGTGLAAQLHAELPLRLAIDHLKRPGRAGDIAQLAIHTQALVGIHLDVFPGLWDDLVLIFEKLTQLRSDELWSIQNAGIAP
jgi:hypothetical protein